MFRENRNTWDALRTLIKYISTLFYINHLHEDAFLSLIIIVLHLFKLEEPESCDKKYKLNA